MKRVRTPGRPAGRLKLDRFIVEGERLTRRALQQDVAEVVLVVEGGEDIEALAGQKQTPSAAIQQPHRELL